MRHVLEGTEMDGLVIAEFAVAHVTVILDDFAGGKSCKRNEYFKPSMQQRKHTCFPMSM